jgi:hypothetical protein
MLFIHGFGVEIFSFSVHLISGNMDEAFHGGTILGAFKENVGSVNVGLGEGKGISKGVIDVSLGGKVEDRVDFVFFEYVGDKIAAADVALYEFEVGKVLDLA